MQQLARSARIVSSPTVLFVAVWSVLLVVIAIGPIDYSNQPSAAVLAIVVIGISLFMNSYDELDVVNVVLGLLSGGEQDV